MRSASTCRNNAATSVSIARACSDAWPLPPPRDHTCCGKCDAVLRSPSKCSGCGHMAYCCRDCQLSDWPKPKRQPHGSVYRRVRQRYRTLFRVGTPLPDCQVRLILSYAIAPPLLARESAFLEGARFHIIWPFSVFTRRPVVSQNQVTFPW